jgi:predicted Fe-S protein YdhL (DUF1289 family)
MEEIALWSSLGSALRLTILSELDERMARIPDRARRATAFRLPGS